jgi:hypothetical protein
LARCGGSAAVMHDCGVVRVWVSSDSGDDIHVTALGSQSVNMSRIRNDRAVCLRGQNSPVQTGRAAPKIEF